MIPFFAQGFPTSPLADGASEIIVLPAYFDSTKKINPGEFKVNGGGIAIAYVRSFSSHWGMSVMGGYQTASGSNSAVTADCPGVCSPLSFNSSPKVKEDSSVVMTTLIYDPFSNPDGLRMPLFLGLAYYKELGVSTFRGSSRGTQLDGEVKRTVSTVLPMLGASVQFNTGPIRWTPFIILSTPSPAKVQSSTTDIQTGQVRSKDTFRHGFYFVQVDTQVGPT